jgi:hypothetical protein
LERARDRRYKLRRLEGKFLPLTMAVKRKSTGPVPGQPKVKTVKSNGKEFNGKKSTVEKAQKVKKEILIQDEEESEEDDFEGFGDDGTNESDVSMEDDEDDLDMSDEEGENEEDKAEDDDDDDEEEVPKPKKKSDNPPKSGTIPQTLPN